MSVLKGALFSILVANCAVITIDAGQKFPPKGPKKTSFKAMATIFEEEQLPKKPSFGPMGKDLEHKVSDFALPCAAIQRYAPVCVNPVLRPSGSLYIRTCSTMASGSRNDWFKLLLKFGKNLKECDCGDARQNHSPKDTKFFHVLCNVCSDASTEKSRKKFYSNDSRSCIDRVNQAQANKAASVKK